MALRLRWYVRHNGEGNRECFQAGSRKLAEQATKLLGIVSVPRVPVWGSFKSEAAARWFASHPTVTSPKEAEHATRPHNETVAAGA